MRELAVRLNDPLSVRVDVACLSPWGPVADQIRSRGVRVMALNARGASDLGAVLRLNRLIGEQQYDTVMSFLIHANAAAAGAKLFYRDVRYIQSIQTTQPDPRWHWTMQHIVQAAAERIVVPSQSAALVAQRWADIPPEKIVVIPNAVEPGEFVQSPVPMGQPTPYPIGFIGRLDPIKQVPVLIRQFARVAQRREVVLHIFGDGSDRPRVVSEISSLNLGDKIILHGTIAKAQEALSQIGMLVLPSAAEGFGLVLIEAMAAGVPVIGNNAPGIVNVVKNEQTGLLVNADTDDELSDAMMRLVDDRTLRLRLIEKGLIEVRERFSWGSLLPAYQRLFGLK